MLGDGSMQDKYLFGMIMGLGLMALEAVALLTGVDGVMFATIMGLVGAICGSILGFSWRMYNGGGNER